METESVIYTDGHDVKVTSSRLVVGKRDYLLSGITAFHLQIIRASKAVPLLLIVLGLIGIVTGLLHTLPPDMINPITVSGKTITVNEIAAIVGGVFVLFGLIAMSIQHDRYAVQITTAEGNKDVIVSQKRDYVDQIVTALGVALTPVV